MLSLLSAVLCAALALWSPLQMPEAIYAGLRQLLYGLQVKDKKLTRSMFTDAESDSFPLERCMRILPHHADTGGFFIAVLEKVAKYPAPVAK